MSFYRFQVEILPYVTDEKVDKLRLELQLPQRKFRVAPISDTIIRIKWSQKVALKKLQALSSFKISIDKPSTNQEPITPLKLIESLGIQRLESCQLLQDKENMKTDHKKLNKAYERNIKTLFQTKDHLDKEINQNILVEHQLQAAQKKMQALYLQLKETEIKLKNAVQRVSVEKSRADQLIRHPHEERKSLDRKIKKQF